MEILLYYLCEHQTLCCPDKSNAFFYVYLGFKILGRLKLSLCQLFLLLNEGPLLVAPSRWQSCQLLHLFPEVQLVLLQFIRRPLADLSNVTLLPQWSWGEWESPSNISRWLEAMAIFVTPGTYFGTFHDRLYKDTEWAQLELITLYR